MIDATGIHPMEDKVRAIHEAPIPQDVTQLRAFVGLLNYYEKFIPQVATHVALLYKLLEKDHKWALTEECDTTFKTCKDLLTSEAVFAHYDTLKPIKLACDASSYGLGAVLSHVSEEGEQPIAFVSRSLSKAERNYSQIEKEALVFGVKKFHKYVFGRRFTLLTNHKPLMFILNPKSSLPLISAAAFRDG